MQQFAPSRVLDDGAANCVDPLLLLLHTAHRRQGKRRCSICLDNGLQGLIHRATQLTHGSTACGDASTTSSTLQPKRFGPHRSMFTRVHATHDVWLTTTCTFRTLSVSAMKNWLSVLVEISNALALLMVSSAPLMDRHLLT